MIIKICHPSIYIYIYMYKYKAFLFWHVLTVYNSGHLTISDYYLNPSSKIFGHIWCSFSLTLKSANLPKSTRCSVQIISFDFFVIIVVLLAHSHQGKFCKILSTNHTALIWCIVYTFKSMFLTNNSPTKWKSCPCTFSPHKEITSMHLSCFVSNILTNQIAKFAISLTTKSQKLNCQDSKY